MRVSRNEDYCVKIGCACARSLEIRRASFNERERDLGRRDREETSCRERPSLLLKAGKICHFDREEIAAVANYVVPLGGAAARRTDQERQNSKCSHRVDRRGRL